MPPPDDLTGRTRGTWRVLGRVYPFVRKVRWWCRCSRSLGGCGRVKPLTADAIRTGRTSKCIFCHQGHLHQPVWPLVCLNCRTPFTGIARQRFCRRKCQRARKG